MIDRKHLMSLSIKPAFCYRISLLCTMVLGLTVTVTRGFLLLQKVSVQNRTLIAPGMKTEVVHSVWNVEGVVGFCKLLIHVYETTRHYVSENH